MIIDDFNFFLFFYAALQYLDKYVNWKEILNNLNNKKKIKGLPISALNWSARILDKHFLSNDYSPYHNYWKFYWIYIYEIQTIFWQPY